MPYEDQQPSELVQSYGSLHDETAQILFDCSYDDPLAAVSAETLGGRACQLLGDLGGARYENMSAAAREAINDAISRNPDNVEINKIGHVVVREGGNTRVFMPNGDNVTFGAGGAIQQMSGRFVAENIGALGMRLSHLPEQRGARGGGIDWFPAKPQSSQSWHGTSRSGLNQPQRKLIPSAL